MNDFSYRAGFGQPINYNSHLKSFYHSYYQPYYQHMAFVHQYPYTVPIMQPQSQYHNQYSAQFQVTHPTLSHLNHAYAYKTQYPRVIYYLLPQMSFPFYSSDRSIYETSNQCYSVSNSQNQLPAKYNSSRFKPISEKPSQTSDKLPFKKSLSLEIAKHCPTVCKNKSENSFEVDFYFKGLKETSGCYLNGSFEKTSDYDSTYEYSDNSQGQNTVNGSILTEIFSANEYSKS